MPYDIAATAIIVRERSYGNPEFLITRRALDKKRFPGKWTVPGGKLEPQDYQARPKDTAECWYNVLEDTVKREVREEVGIDIAEIVYLCSMVGDSGFVCLSYMADYRGGEVKLQAGEAIEHAWVTLEEAANYDLIDGILEELVIAHNRQTGFYELGWRRETSSSSSTATSA